MMTVSSAIILSRPCLFYLNRTKLPDCNMEGPPVRGVRCVIKLGGAFVVSYEVVPRLFERECHTLVRYTTDGAHF